MTRADDESHNTEPAEDLEMQLPMTGPRALNPIVWRRRFATPRGQGTLLVAGSLFALAVEAYYVVSYGFFGPMTLMMGCVALPIGAWLLLTGIAVSSARRPLWWWIGVCASAAAGFYVDATIVRKLSPPHRETTPLRDIPGSSSFVP
jgi:hypothetical protein